MKKVLQPRGLDSKTVIFSLSPFLIRVKSERRKNAPLGNPNKRTIRS